MLEKDARWLTNTYYVSALNHAPEVRAQFDLPPAVRIHEVTLREAEQAPHVVLRPEEKLRLYEALDDMGVFSVEVFPIVSADDRELALELVRKRRAEERRAKVFFLCRFRLDEVDFALEAGADGVVVEGPGNPFVAKTVLGWDEEELLARMTAATAHAARNGLFTNVMPWDTLRAPLHFLERAYKGVVEAGADHVTIADTFGFGLPWTVQHLVRTVRSWVPGVPVEMHAHNDWGMATSVMLSAVIAGASVVHTSTNAVGERAGNAATDEVVMGLEVLLGVDTGVKTEHLYPVSQLVAELSKLPVPPNKPVVGENEFLFESGQVAFLNEKIRAAGVPFQSFLPELIGRKGYGYVLGKMSGGEIITQKLAELGIEAGKEQVAAILERVKAEAGIRKWSVSDDVLVDIAREVLDGAAAGTATATAVEGATAP
jgi:2-isopropylmalate synthase